MKLKRIALSLVLFLSLLTAIAPAADKPITDNYLVDSVRTRLAADTVVKGGNIDVDAKDGVVTLKGKVQEPRQKDKAEKLAKKVRGVKSVVNDITIEKP